MSRISKWKLEKTKAKVVFRLQFHATHIPQTGWDKLFISFIPADSGKATAKTTKANVRNGTCKWADPIYETTRLLQDSKSKQYDEKIYKIVVSMGSSRAGTLGEATINLADYIDALKPSSASLPLHGCNFGTILHITVQLLTSKTGFREFEQQREFTERGLNDSCGHGAIDEAPYSEEVTCDQNSKVSERIKLKEDANELCSLEGEVNLNEECVDSATGLDGLSNTSESLCAEKPEISGTCEIDNLKATTSGDLHVLSHCQTPHTVKEHPSDQNMAQGSTGSAQGWGSDNSMDNELAMACEENNQLSGSLELAESSFFNLKLEVSSLQSLANELRAETQKLSHLFADEISSTEKLEKEVSVMKSECLKFKDDIIRLKDLKFSPVIPTVEFSDNKVNDLVHNMQLQFLKGIASVEGKIRELQNKTNAVHHDRDPNFINIELEALLNFLLDLKHGNDGATVLLNAIPSEKTDVKEIKGLNTYKNEQFVSGNGLGLELCEPEIIPKHFSVIPPVPEVVDHLGAIDAMKGQIFDLVRELDEAKVEKEGLVRKMDQMECYYEALIQELEENQKHMVAELQHLRNEHSTCLYTISSSRVEMESLREDMNQQMLQFLDERHDLEARNKELERRATTSEAVLRRARLNYSIAVDKLQKDLELLSSQVTSMFEANENLIKHALPSQPYSQGDQKLLQNPEDANVSKVSQLQNENLNLSKRLVGGGLRLEDLKRSLCSQEENYQKVEGELMEMYSLNLNLDIYSKLLQESLRDADTDIRIMREKMDDLVEELKLSTTSENQLMLKLQKATDDICVLNEYKSSSISHCSDMALQIQSLEDKLVSISKEKYLLAQKLKDCESTLVEYRSYQNKYGASLAENADLSLHLQQKTFEYEKLTNEMSLLKEKFTILESESGELVSFKENLEKKFSFVQDKLDNLLESYSKHLCFFPNHHGLKLESLDIKDALLHLEEMQHNACVKFCQLMEENQNLRGERDIADVSLSDAKSEILVMKQKFKNDVQDMVTKLDVSNALVDKLQTELESVASKLHLSSEIEETYAHHSKVLLDDLALLEDQMQELTCGNGYFAQEISVLDAVTEELGRSKLTIAELMHDNQELAMCLQGKTEESIKLSCEISGQKETLQFFNDELHEEKAYKDELEGKIRDLTSCLNSDQEKLLIFEQQKAELAMCLQRNSEESTELSCEMSCLKENLKIVQDELHEEKAYKDVLEGRVRDLTSDMNRDRDKLLTFEQQKAELATCLQNKSEESIKLSEEISCLKENLKNLQDELHEEKAYRDELLAGVRDLTSCLNIDQEKLLNLEQKKAELMRVRKVASDLELEKSKVAHLLGQQNVFMDKLQMNNSYQASLESHLLEMHYYSLAADVKLIYLANHYEALLGQLLQKLLLSEGCLRELQKGCDDREAMLNHCEANWNEEKASLLISLKSLKAELEVSGSQNKLLSYSNNQIWDQLEELNRKLTMMVTSLSLDNILQASEVEQLKSMMIEAEEEKSYLTVLKEELEIFVIALKGKVDELSADLTSLEGYKDELMMLCSQCSEFSHELSEQVLKREEFKNLYTHLKELQGKAEAEGIVAHEKGETEAAPAAAQDSLQIAFIKEQYETNIQELKQQLSVSKKRGEEILLKLQDAIDEIEVRRKSEAVSLKRNEELSLKLQTLETELQLALAEMQEKSEAYDQTKAELECALLSLECCKGEKEKLGASLLDFEAEKCQLSVELTSVKDQLEDLKSSIKFVEDEYGSVAKAEHDELNWLNGNSFPVFMDQDESTSSIERESVISVLDGEISDSTKPVQSQNVQDTALSGLNQITEFLATKEFPQSNGKRLDVNSEHMGAQRLKSSMEHLHELEKMKNENTVFNLGHDVSKGFQCPQTEIMKLHKVNEELKTMFPSFNEISSGGNALERILALEIEVAEALKEKNKLNVQFLCSFLKQPGNEEAVFKSFKDINDLLKETLDLKGRHAAMEAELREMHERYSQLSLQFAEVEGERQKLKMTLTNVKLATLNRSSSADVMGHPS